MALLGTDLLRMHNNKAVFRDYKQHQAGFFEILGDPEPAEAADGGSLTIRAADDSTVTAQRRPPSELVCADLYNLSEQELHSIAAILATLLMMQRWQKQLPKAERKEVTAEQVQKSLQV